jgi:hypothetical protein
MTATTDPMSHTFPVAVVDLGDDGATNRVYRVICERWSDTIGVTPEFRSYRDGTGLDLTGRFVVTAITGVVYSPSACLGCARHAAEVLSKSNIDFTNQRLVDELIANGENPAISRAFDILAECEDAEDPDDTNH